MARRLRFRAPVALPHPTTAGVSNPPSYGEQWTDLEKVKKEKSEAFTALDEAEEAGKNGTDYWVK
ncbi:hypothetical protein [Nocardia brasiliensis]|uniref:hypothetical protein n=1 Tax=Nocardia brasiliensis TaxID=37326 RepID=UPI00366E7FAE